jgi:riboflavin kinase
VSKDALVEDIREDIRVAQRSLDREAYAGWKEDGWLSGKDDGRRDSFVRKDQSSGQKDAVGICRME